MIYPVSEIFYSIQGEGESAGKRAIFIRLGGCNLMCGGQGTQHDKKLHNGATWRCDTVEVWMNSKSVSLYDIFETEVGSMEAPLKMLIEHDRDIRVIITGGEPLIHDLLPMLDYIQQLNYETVIEIETNGTIYPPKLYEHFNVRYNVSPKLANSGNPEHLRVNKSAIKYFVTYGKAVFKIVVSSMDDYNAFYDDYVSIVDDLDDFYAFEKVYFMPAGESKEELDVTRPIAAEMALRRGANYSPRLHIDIWNKKTGV